MSGNLEVRLCQSLSTSIGSVPDCIILFTNDKSGATLQMQLPRAEAYTSLQVASSTVDRNDAGCPAWPCWKSCCFLGGRAAVRAARERLRMAEVMDLARPAKCCSSSAKLRSLRNCWCSLMHRFKLTPCLNLNPYTVHHACMVCHPRLILHIALTQVKCWKSGCNNARALVLLKKCRLMRDPL